MKTKHEKIVEILEKHQIKNGSGDCVPDWNYEDVTIAIDQIESEGEKVPNLSKLDKTNKDEFINEFIEMMAKNVLSVFVALGLKTHIEATVVNNDEPFELIFRKKLATAKSGNETPPKRGMVSDDDITEALENFLTEKGYCYQTGTDNSDADLFEDGFMTAIDWLRKTTLNLPTKGEKYKYLSEFWDFMEDAQIDDTQGRWSVKDLIQAYMKQAAIKELLTSKG